MLPAAVVTAQESDPLVEAARKQKEGDGLLAQDRFQEALNCYEATLDALQHHKGTVDPSQYAFCLCGLSQCHRNLQNLDKALQLAEDAVAKVSDVVDPTGLHCLHVRALAHYAKGSFAQALHDWDLCDCNGGAPAEVAARRHECVQRLSAIGNNSASSWSALPKNPSSLSISGTSQSSSAEPTSPEISDVSKSAGVLPQGARQLKRQDSRLSGSSCEPVEPFSPATPATPATPDVTKSTGALPQGVRQLRRQDSRMSQGSRASSEKIPGRSVLRRQDSLCSSSSRAKHRVSFEDQAPPNMIKEVKEDSSASSDSEIEDVAPEIEDVTPSPTKQPSKDSTASFSKRRPSQDSTGSERSPKEKTKEEKKKGHQKGKKPEISAVVPTDAANDEVGGEETPKKKMSKQFSMGVLSSMASSSKALTGVKALQRKIEICVASSPVLNRLIICCLRFLFLWDIITDWMLAYFLWSEGHPYWAGFSWGFMALSYFMMAVFLNGHFVDRLSTKIKPRIAAMGFYWIFWLPLFMLNDLNIFFGYPFSEPRANDLFTYIRVRQISEMMFEAIPQSFLQAYIAYAQNNLGLYYVDPKWLSMAIISSAFSILIYSRMIKRYALVHTDGDILAYIRAMKDLGSGLAPTSLITEINKLQTVTCTFDRLSVRAFTEIATAVITSSRLQTLQFTRTYLDDEALPEITRAVKEAKFRFRRLLLGNVGAGRDALLDLLKAIQAREDFCLEMWGMEVNSDDSDLLEQVLRGETQGKSIDDSGAFKLAGAAVASTLIDKLDLTDNDIGDAGATELARVLPDTHLESLILTKNKISDVGARLLGEALIKSKLMVLDLSDNTISRSCMVRLLLALESSSIDENEQEGEDADHVMLNVKPAAKDNAHPDPAAAIKADKKPFAFFSKLQDTLNPKATNAISFGRMGSMQMQPESPTRSNSKSLEQDPANKGSERRREFQLPGAVGRLPRLIAMGFDAQPGEGTLAVALLRNDLHELLGDKDLKMVAGALERSPLVREVDLSGVPSLLDPDLADLLEAASNGVDGGPTVNAWGYRLGKVECSVLCKALRGASQCLDTPGEDLRGSNLGPQEAQILANALEATQRLRDLDVRDNPMIDKTSVLRLLRALEGSANEKARLRLWNSWIVRSNVGIWRSLLHGSLAQFGLYDAEAAVLAEAIGECALPELAGVVIDMRGNTALSRGAAARLLGALKRSPLAIPPSLNLWGYDMDRDEAVVAINLLSGSIQGLADDIEENRTVAVRAMVRCIEHCSFSLNWDLTLRGAGSDMGIVLPLMRAFERRYLGHLKDIEVTVKLWPDVTLSTFEGGIFRRLLDCGAFRLAGTERNTEPNSPSVLEVIALAVRSCPLLRMCRLDVAGAARTEVLAVLEAALKRSFDDASLDLYLGDVGPLQSAQDLTVVQRLITGELQGPEVDDNTVRLLASALLGPLREIVKTVDMADHRVHSQESLEKLGKVLQGSLHLNKLRLASETPLEKITPKNRTLSGITSSEDPGAPGDDPMFTDMTLMDSSGLRKHSIPTIDLNYADGGVSERRTLMAWMLRGLQQGRLSEKTDIELWGLTVKKTDVRLIYRLLEDRLGFRSHRDEPPPTFSAEELILLESVIKKCTCLSQIQLTGVPQLLEHEVAPRLLSAAEANWVAVELWPGRHWRPGPELRVLRGLFEQRLALLGLSDGDAETLAAILRLRGAADTCPCVDVSGNKWSKVGYEVFSQALEALLAEEDDMMDGDTGATGAKSGFSGGLRLVACKQAALWKESGTVPKEDLEGLALLARACCQHSMREPQFEADFFEFPMQCRACELAAELLSPENAEEWTRKLPLTDDDFAMLWRMFEASLLSEADLRWWRHRAGESLTELTSDLVSKALVDQAARNLPPTLLRLSNIPLWQLAASEQSLVELDLRNQKLGEIEGLLIAGVLGSTSPLRQLDLRQNPLMGEQAAGAFVTGLTSSRMPLHMLSGIPVSNLVQLEDLQVEDAGEFEAVTLARMLEHLAGAGPKNVDLRGGVICDAGVRAFVALLVAQKQWQGDSGLETLSGMPIGKLRRKELTEIELEETGLQDFEVRVLAALLEGDATVTVVNLRGNKMGPPGVRALEHMVHSNKSIESLCGLPIQRLVSAAPTTGLRDLSMAKMGLGDPEVQILVEMLQQQKDPLRSLNLIRNGRISPDSVAVLRPWAMGTRGPQLINGIPIRRLRAADLAALDLANQDLGVFDALFLMDVLTKENRSLIKLSLQGNLFSHAWPHQESSGFGVTRGASENRREASAAATAAGVRAPTWPFWGGPALKMATEDSYEVLRKVRDGWAEANGGCSLGHMEEIIAAALLLLKEHPRLETLSDLPIRKLCLNASGASPKMPGREMRRGFPANSEPITMDLRNLGLGDFETLLVCEGLCRLSSAAADGVSAPSIHVDLRRNPIGLAGAKGLADTLMQINGIGAELQKSVAGSEKIFPNLVISPISVSQFLMHEMSCVDLRGAGIGDPDICLLLHLIQLGSVHLDELDVRENDLSLYATGQLCKYVCQTKGSPKIVNGIPAYSLRNGELSGCLTLPTLTDVEAYLLAALLQVPYVETCTELTGLSLKDHKCSMGGGMQALSLALGHVTLAEGAWLVGLAKILLNGGRVIPVDQLRVEGPIEIRKFKLAEPWEAQVFAGLMRCSPVTHIKVPSQLLPAPCSVHSSADDDRGLRLLKSWEGACSEKLEKLGVIEQDHMQVRIDDEPLVMQGNIGDLEILAIAASLRSGIAPRKIDLRPEKVDLRGLFSCRLSSWSAIAMLHGLLQCEGPEEVNGIPVRALRDDKVVNLDLSSQRLGDFEIVLLSRLISQFAGSLETMDLRGNPDITAVGARALLGVTKAMASQLSVGESKKVKLWSVSGIPIAGRDANGELLTKLDFCSAGLCDFEAYLLCEMLSDDAFFNNLDLRDNKAIGGNASEALRKVLASQKNLVKVCGIPLQDIRMGNVNQLNMRGQGLGDFEVLLLTQLLESRIALLTNLDLRDNVISVSVTPKIIQALRVATMVETFSGMPVSQIQLNLVSNLNLEKCGLKDPEMMVLLVLLKENTSVANLHLNDNAFSRDGILAFCEALNSGQMPNVKKVGEQRTFQLKQLQDGKIGELPVDDCHLGDFDLRVLAEGIKDSTVLEKISLKGIRFSDEVDAAVVLAEAVLANQSLEKVNQMPVGILRRHQSRVIDMRGFFGASCQAHVTDFEIVLLAEILKKNTSVEIVYFDSEKPSQIAASAFGGMLKENESVDLVNGLPTQQLEEELDRLSLGPPRRRGKRKWKKILREHKEAFEEAERLAKEQAEATSKASKRSSIKDKMKGMAGLGNKRSSLTSVLAQTGMVADKSASSQPADGGLIGGKRKTLAERAREQQMKEEREAAIKAENEASSCSSLEAVAEQDLGDEEPKPANDEEEEGAPPLHTFEICLIAELLPKAQKLTKMDVTADVEGMPDSVVDQMLKAIFEAPVLKTAYGLGVQPLKDLRGGRLENLELACHGMGAFEGKLVLPLLSAPQAANLKHLDLRQNLLPVQMMEKFTDLIVAKNGPETDKSEWPILGGLETFGTCIPVKALNEGSVETLNVANRAIGDFEGYVIAAFLTKPCQVKVLEAAGMMLDESGEAAKSLKRMLRTNKTLETANSIPVQQLKDDVLMRLPLTNAVLGDLEAAILAELLKENHNLKLLQLANSSGCGSVAQMWKSAVTVMRSVEESPNQKLEVGLWGQTVKNEECGKMRKLMEMQLKGNQGADEKRGSTMEDFHDTPLARLCLIPMTEIEQDAIKEVNLRDRGITDFEMMILSDLVRKNRSLRKVDLRNNDKITDAAVERFAGAVRSHPAMMEVSGIAISPLEYQRNLDLSRCGLGDVEAKLLAEIMSGTNKAVHLTMKGNRFTKKAAPSLLEVVGKCPHLESVSGMPLKDIKGSRTSELDLIRKELGDFEAFLLAEALRGNHSLQKLHVEGNYFSSIEAAQALGLALREHKKLYEFNSLPIAELKQNSLKELKLPACSPPLGDFDAVVLAGQLTGRDAVTAVDLSNNQIGVKGFQHLSAAFGTLPLLKYLDVQGNAELRRSSVAALIRALLGCSETSSASGSSKKSGSQRTLTVNVWGQEIHAAQLSNLAQVLDDNLAGIVMTDEIMDLVEMVFKTTEFLTQIDLKGTQINKAQLLRLLKAAGETTAAKVQLGLWGMYVFKADFDSVREELESREEVDMFRMVAVIGNRHGGRENGISSMIPSRSISFCSDDDASSKGGDSTASTPSHKNDKFKTPFPSKKKP
jgi:hypothetical protein